MPGLSVQTANSVACRASRSVAHVAITVCAILLAACDGTSSPAPVTDPRQPPPVHLAECVGPATGIPDSLARLVSPSMARTDGDVYWADLARTIPGGFAGMFYDSAHTPILMLTQPARAAEAKQALLRRGLPYPIAAATVREARWDFAQLVDLYNYLRSRITVRNVTSDKDESINRIRSSVTSVAARDSLVSALSALPLPCDLVVVDLNGVTWQFVKR